MRYYLIAGEASGDLHAANLMKEIRILDSDATFRCWGGDLMQKEGGVLVRHYRDLAFMGFLEVLSHLPAILGNLRFCRKDIIDFHPDVLILIDYPGFNLRIARSAVKSGIRVFYYISPQLWAWRSSRVKIIRESVEHMFVILPFEKDFYNRYGVKAEFHGHPLMDVIHEDMALKNKDRFLSENGLDDRPVIALLPGSRKMEIVQMLNVMLRVIPHFPRYQFVIATAPSVEPEFYNSITKNSKVGLVRGQTYDLLKHCVAAAVTSGTATLETALMNVPQVVCYRGNTLSYLIARLIVKVPFISLVNLIAGEKVVEELIQQKFNVQTLITALEDILKPDKKHKISDGYLKLRSLLGGRGASGRTARSMIQYLREK